MSFANLSNINCKAIHKTYARVARVSTSLNHRGFYDNTSLHHEKIEKNPVSLVLKSVIKVTPTPIRL